MQNRELSRHIQRLQSLVQRTAEACGSNLELQSQWAKYLCVLSAGLLENGMKEIYTEYAHGVVSQPIANYISASLQPLRNPKSQKFIEFAGYFKEAWKTELEEYLLDDGRGDAIDSIMNNRHLIAHGKEIDSKITMGQVKTYLEKAIQVLEYIEAQCKK